MARFQVPPPFRGPTAGEAEVEVAGATVRECIEAADARHPGFRAQLLTPSGEPHRFIRFSLNGRVLVGAALDRAVGPDDEVAILANIAGG